MFKSTHMVRFDDVDGAGIVYYPRYFHFCHKSFEDFFNQKAQVSYPHLINDMGLGFPTVKVSSQFFKPFFYGDAIVSEFRVLNIGNSSMNCHYQFYNSESNILSFEAEIKVVCMNLETKKSQPIPKNLRSIFENILVAK